MKTAYLYGDTLDQKIGENVKRDIILMKKTLVDLGYQVNERINNQFSLENANNDASNHQTASGHFLYYFSCHGNDEGLLIFNDGYLSLPQFSIQVAGLNSDGKHCSIVVDSCCNPNPDADWEANIN
jgi:uncharacterized caspase-like protein